MGLLGAGFAFLITKGKKKDLTLPIVLFKPWCIFTPIDVITRCIVIFKLSLNNKNTWFLNKKLKKTQLPA
jgi:hypothetical protein